MTTYFEGDRSLTPPPDWVRWFISLGMNFPVNSPAAVRNILLVSTPCDTPGAGLVSLGVVMRDLARERGTNVENHAQAIRAWASQNAGGEIFKINDKPGGQRTKFLVASCHPDGTLSLYEAPKANRQNAKAAGPSKWHFGPGQNPDQILAQFSPDGWARAEAAQATVGIDVTPYRLLVSDGSLLVSDWAPLELNCRHSYAGACLVGRSTGTTDTRRLLEEVGFEHDATRHPLSMMLSILGWGSDPVSRLRYYNSRRGNGTGFDRPGSPPEVAVVDGARELAAVLANNVDFGTTSLIGVVARDVDTKVLQDLSLALIERRFGPQADTRTLDPPAGISVQWVRPL